MIIKCSSCGSRYRVSDDLVADGPKRFKCKNCGAVLLIKPPAASTPKPDKPEAGDKTPPPEQAAAPPGGDGGRPKAAPAAADEEESAPDGAGADEEAADGQDENGFGEESSSQEEEDLSGLSPEELAARQQQNIQEKLEKRRQQMEDEISGRLNKAALETLDFDVLSELAKKIQEIQNNTDFHVEEETKLFSCIKCKTTFCIYPDDSRICSNCSGEIALVRADDILKQYGMFG